MVNLANSKSRMSIAQYTPKALWAADMRFIAVASLSRLGCRDGRPRRAANGSSPDAAPARAKPSTHPTDSATRSASTAQSRAPKAVSPLRRLWAPRQIQPPQTNGDDIAHRRRAKMRKNKLEKLRVARAKHKMGGNCAPQARKKMGKKLRTEGAPR